MAPAVSLNQVITLGGLEAKGLSQLEVVCDRCGRRGLYSVARLIEHQGRDHDLVSLRLLLFTVGCPTYHTGKSPPRCGAYYPQLPGLFLPPAAEG
jgi:hypothetical protein